MAGTPDTQAAADGPGERSPLAELLRIAAPVAAAMVSYTFAQFVDSKMVAQLPNGAEALSAQGNGAILAFVPISLMMGLATVINTFASQHIGAGRPERAAAYAWNGMWLALLAWAAVFVPMGLTLGWWLPAATGGASLDPDVARMQAEYARILLLGAVFTTCGRALAQFFYGLHRPGIILTATLLGAGVNILGNWLLIFGNWGFPRLEVAGAAYATVAGQMVEFAVPLAVFLSRRLQRTHRTRSAWRPSRRESRDILRVGWPAALMFGNEMACWAIFMALIIGSISVADNAAGWIGLRYMQLSFLPAVGLSIAVTAVVGRCMGAGRPDLARRRAWLGMRVAMVYMGSCAAAFLLFREPLVRVFLGPEMDPERAADTLRIGMQVMICAAVFQVMDAVGIIMVGALRGAGDTRWPGVVTVALSWGVLIGGGFALARAFPEWRSIGPWAAASAYIILFAGAMLWRFWRGRWASIRLVERAGDSEVAPAA